MLLAMLEMGHFKVMATVSLFHKFDVTDSMR